MVGASRSSGCSLCVQRRLKCDERLPGCKRCETYGRPCPGYHRDFKFVPGRPYRRRRIRGMDSEKAVSSHVDEEFQDIYQPLIEAFGLANANILQSLNILIDDFSATPFSPSLPHIVPRWFGFLPGIHGRNMTLDAAIKSFTAHHLGNMTGNLQMIHYAQFAYVEALWRLRKSLNKPTERFSSDIFCSVMLLSLYELFSNTRDPACWMKHAKGLSQLAEFRGLDRYRTEFDSILLKASRGIIIMHSLFSGQECFLASEDWHSVMKEHYDKSLPAGLGYLLEEFIAYFTHVPSLVHKLYHLKQVDQASPETLVQMSETLIRTLEMKSKLDAWYEGFSSNVPTPYETISPSGNTLYPVVLSYSDVNSASLFCGYYSYMAIIHELFRACGYPGEHEAMVIYFRDQICKSVEYNGRGLLGPYRMAFPLRVAFEVADPVVKSWIESWLMRFSNVYPAVHPQKFG